MKKNKESARVVFGQQLYKYRGHCELTQKQLAELAGSNRTYIRLVEKGEISIGIDNMETFAKHFGVEHYELSNPNFPVPTMEKMPQALKDFIQQQKLKRKQAKEAQQTNEEKLMKELLKSTFLRNPKTAEEITAKLSAKIALKPSRVKALLREKGLKELVKVVPGEGTYVLRG